MIAPHFSWEGVFTPPVLLLLVACVVYPLSHFSRRAFRLLLRRAGAGGEAVEVWSWVSARIFGGLVLGAVPLAAALLMLGGSVRDYGVNLHRLPASVWISVVGSVLSAGGIYVGSRIWPGSLKGYPEITVRRWDAQLLLLNAAGWTVYLAGYEIFFRGVLLFALAAYFGGWPAIAITTALYTYTHLPKEPHEVAATALYGVLFGIVGLWTGSVLAPFLVHLSIAPTAEFLAIRADQRAARPLDAAPVAAARG